MQQTQIALINQFKHRCVRDLAWVIASPPLVSGTIDDVRWWDHSDCLAEFDDCLMQLQTLDVNPEPLNTYLSNLKNKKLGSLFEGFISFWLHISPNYQEILHNVQIIEDNHTFGEIDFIIEELSTGRIIHLEVAVKFYLGCKPYSDAYRWFGTTIVDQLGKKIDHLKSHQTQLTKKYPEHVKNYFTQTIDERHCIVKGRLFYPDGISMSPQNINLATNHLRGTWRYAEEYNPSERLIKINKSDWMAKFNSEDIQNSECESKASISSIDRAECYVKIEKNDTVSFEKKRIFYLPKTFIFPE